MILCDRNVIVLIEQRAVNPAAGYCHSRTEHLYLDAFESSALLVYAPLGPFKTALSSDLHPRDERADASAIAHFL